jgi:hypothetical protein
LIFDTSRNSPLGDGVTLSKTAGRPIGPLAGDGVERGELAREVVLEEASSSAPSEILIGRAGDGFLQLRERWVPPFIGGLGSGRG